MARDQEILQAATKLFYERGFHAVGVDEIGERTGITGPAIYRHFSGKDEILATLFDQALDRIGAKLGEVREDPREELEHLVAVYSERAIDDRLIAGVHGREAHALADPFRRRIHRREREFVRRWIDCLSRCFPKRSEEECTSATHATLGLLHSVAFWPPEAMKTDDLEALLNAMVLGGLVALDEERSGALAKR